MIEVILLVLAVVVGVAVVMRMDVEPREVLTQESAGEPSDARPSGSDVRRD